MNNNNEISTILTDETLLVVVGETRFMMDTSHSRFDTLIAAINTGNPNEILATIDILKKVREWASDNLTNVEIRGKTVFFNGEPLHNHITKRITDWIDAGISPEPMVKFLTKIWENPSHTAREELLLFLEACQLPVTKDGDFLAYKTIRHNWTDNHTGKFDNSVGQVVEMPRGEVDDDRNNTCSSGLHFAASESYIKWFGNTDGRDILIKINPKDVVSIPSDYNNEKGRCCRYEVIKELDKKLTVPTKEGLLYDESQGEEEYSGN